MANELAVISNIDIDNAGLENLAAVARETQAMRLLKFNKGKWLIGDDIVDGDDEYIAHIHELARGWVKFQDGRVVDQRVGIVAKSFVVVPREELGDNDSSLWEKDAMTGQPRDPWNKQFYLGFVNAKTGEMLTFVTGSQGGNSAIGRLANQFSVNVCKGLPIVQLSTDSYKHKLYGRTEVPDFKVTGWTGVAGSVAANRDDMNDKIPF
jgi:hypothetical protein